MTYSPDMLIWATIPLLLFAGQRVVQHAVESGRARRSLENIVLNRARSDPSARAALMAYTGKERDTAKVEAVVYEGIQALDATDAAVVQRALRFTAPQGSGNYVLDVARLVKAKLAHI